MNTPTACMACEITVSMNWNWIWRITEFRVCPYRIFHAEHNIAIHLPMSKSRHDKQTEHIHSTSTQTTLSVESKCKLLKGKLVVLISKPDCSNRFRCAPNMTTIDIGTFIHSRIGTIAKKRVEKPIMALITIDTTPWENDSDSLCVFTDASSHHRNVMVNEKKRNENGRNPTKTMSLPSKMN